MLQTFTKNVEELVMYFGKNIIFAFLCATINACMFIPIFDRRYELDFKRSIIVFLILHIMFFVLLFGFSLFTL
ncbi:hypothetical protein BN3456_01027 [Clostridium sp. C105KSO13]|jgi:hypothetical protein|nr:hypothetical protein BN3456_01027 [Clostridium sp. C105KSO13]